MKRIGLPLILLFLLSLAGKTSAQALVCNDLLQIALDNNCTYTMQPEEMLEGVIFPNCIVEIDKVAPLGNGPWVAAVFGPADVGKTYQARVTHTPSGNKCWGNVKLEDKLPPTMNCASVTTVDLNAANPANIAATSLNITAFEGCSSGTITPASLQFDCADLGTNIVTLTATDVAGNTATCLHTVLVSGAEACTPCVSQCPDPVTLTYDEGNNQLLPEFQNNNWAAFDPYGNALNGCSYVDSTYNISYQVGTAGQNWFLRQWVWVDGGGQFSVCEQYILFPTTHQVTISGNIYLDGDDDCVNDAGEQTVNAFPLVLTLQPSGATQNVPVQQDGSYSANVVFDVNTTDAWLSLQLPAGVNPVCASAVNIQNSTLNSALDFDFGIQTNGDCPKMEVDLGSLFLRRCRATSLHIQYCNTGLDTAYGAFVTLNLDSLIRLDGADLPYTVSGADSLYTFQLGDVPPFYCGTFRAFPFVDCDATMGQTLCSQVHIYPDTPCEGAWQGPEIVASAQCEGDSVSLTLKNIGSQDMGSQLNYVVVEDFIMYKDGNFQLNAGETYTVKTAANGATWRIEAEQVPGFPEVTYVAAALEGCGGTNSQGVIQALGQPVDPATSDEDCSPVLASCDPNDKTAVPTGHTEDHVIRPNLPLEYKIRFQNTGNDTAFKVVIVDTLPSQLNPQTLQVGASSHPYRLEIYPGNILHFVFDPIALPDSNVNEVESHGFVQFRILQQADLPEGSRIENQVAIYFDQNDPVFTNVAFHTIGYPIIPNPPLVASSQLQQPSCAGMSNGAIQVTVSGGVPPYTYQWSDPNLQGNILTNLPAGTYEVTVTDDYRGEWINSYTLTEPTALDVTMSSTPASNNTADGTATASASGGTAPYTYLWSNNVTTATNTNLTIGQYTVAVTDANGCTINGAIQVTEGSAPLSMATSASNVSCFGGNNGAISINATGGLLPYTYHWSDANLQGAAVSGLSAGTYTVTLTDALGSELEQSFTIVQPDQIEIVTNTTPATGSLSNGTANANANGGVAPYTYLWSNGSTAAQLLNVPAGTYEVTVTDAGGCTSVETATVALIPAPAFQTVATNNPLCFGSATGSILVTVTGGTSPYTYNWSDPTLQGNNPTNIPAGNYDLTVTDHNGATLTASFSLADPAPVVVQTASTPHTQIPHDGTVSATASGGVSPYTYTWNMGATTASVTNLPAGTYTVTVADNNGCTAIETVEVDELVATGEPGLASGIKVWPNPAHDQVNISMEKVLPELLSIDVLAADGRLLQRIPAGNLQAQMRLELGQYTPSGLLLIVFHARNGSVATEKVQLR